MAPEQGAQHEWSSTFLRWCCAESGGSERELFAGGKDRLRWLNAYAAWAGGRERGEGGGKGRVSGEGERGARDRGREGGRERAREPREGRGGGKRTGGVRPSGGDGKR
eukprot:scaffold157686_cov30-Tisochrysis_lutea.AAC.1